MTNELAGDYTQPMQALPSRPDRRTDPAPGPTPITSPELSSAMASGSYEPYFEVSVWDAHDVFQGSTPHVYEFEIEPLQLEVTIPLDIFDTWAIGYKIGIARGARINGTPSTISSSRFQIREQVWGDMKLAGTVRTSYINLTDYNFTGYTVTIRCIDVNQTSRLTISNHWAAEELIDPAA